MKKLLYLLFAVTFIGCSSDDDNSQTFLKKYDGVVWEEESTISNPDYSYKMKFLNSPKTFVGNEQYGSQNSCDYYLFEEINQIDTDRTTHSIILENSENTLIFQVIEKAFGEETDNYIVTYMAINNGNTLMREDSASSSGYTYNESFRRSNELMCN